MLQAVTFKFPNDEEYFIEQLFSLLVSFGTRRDEQLVFTNSQPDYHPKIVFEKGQVSHPLVQLDDIEIELANTTGENRQSPETYNTISISDFGERTRLWRFLRLDHVGFNLPWFEGVHPDILKLRHELPSSCAYYRFPSGQEWDFILPASEEEILGHTIDLSRDRHPKLEIVSFDKSSTPLVQIDFSVDKKLEEIERTFPEGIVDRDLKNVWVYLKNPYGIDICLVVGEHNGEDWSNYFEGQRLIDIS